MKNTDKSIINFAYFTANFPHNFIKKCWGNGVIADHIREKLQAKREGGFISMGSFMKFFMELDTENKEKLTQWVNENYLAFDYLKQIDE